MEWKVWVSVKVNLMWMTYGHHFWGLSDLFISNRRTELAHLPRPCRRAIPQSNFQAHWPIGTRSPGRSFWEWPRPRSPRFESFLRFLTTWPPPYVWGGVPKIRNWVLIKHSSKVLRDLEHRQGLKKLVGYVKNERNCREWKKSARDAGTGGQNDKEPYRWMRLFLFRVSSAL